MASFSQRIGVKPIKAVLQLDSMDDDLRNGLWNRFTVHVERLEAVGRKKFFRRLWLWHYKQPIDQMPDYSGDRMTELRERYFRWNWSEVYDFIEFAAVVFLETRAGGHFIASCNAVLEKELSAYRFVGRELTRITNEQELEAISSARELSGHLKPVRQHFKAAVTLLSDRKDPDYRNSIKESIGAVEAMCKIITGLDNAVLPEALKRLEEKGVQLHSALKKSFISLYGYTSDANVIRHALLESRLDFDDAKFMLVSCAAFVSYLAAKAAMAGVTVAEK
jgi:hypothetical protein